MYALRVRNLNEKERRKVDMELDRAAMRVQLQAAGGHDPRRRRRHGPVPGSMPTDPNATVIETKRFRKVVPQGFTAAELARDAAAVRSFVASTGGGSTG